MCSKLTIKKLEQGQWRRSGFLIVNFEHISDLFLVFLLLTLSKYMLIGNSSFRYKFFKELNWVSNWSNKR